MRLLKKRKIALALGGGAARGLANIGVLKVLERERIPLDLIVGSSIGSFVGAGYGIGVPTYRMEEAALKFSVDSLTDFSLSRTSVLKGKKLEKVIREFTDGKTFEDSQIPLAITTTDIETGEELVYTRGDLQELIKASCSWPGIFPPVMIGGRKLVDGGIRNSIPSKMARRLGATVVIAVDVGFCVKTTKLENLFQLFIQSIQIMGKELDAYQSMQADVVIKPKLHNIDQFAFEQARRAISDGEDAAQAAIPQIRKILGLNVKRWKPS